jgi:hypothetical protein
MKPKRAMALLVSIASLIFITATASPAAEYVWKGKEDDGAVFVDGEIQFNDHVKFLAALGDRRGSPGLPVTVQLNSEGGNFEEALKIAAIVQDRLVTTALAPHATCLSGCAIIFMSGRSSNSSYFMISRHMHPTAILGFHAPATSAMGGKFDSEDLQSAYSLAVDQVGKKLMDIARFRDESWNNPVMKPGLVTAMMSHSAGNFFFIDTVGKAAEFEIELDEAGGPKLLDTGSRLSACQNTTANVKDSSIADFAFAKGWSPSDETKKRDHQSGLTTYSFEVMRGKGRFCDVTPRKYFGAVPPRSYPIDVNRVTIGVGGGGTLEIVVPDWYFWSAETKLASLPLLNQSK